MQGDWYKPGDWNAICDICGLRFKASQLRRNWKNEYVCETDYETRHPQDFIRVRPEKIAPPWTRPEGEDQFVGPVCYIWGQSAYADLASADCAKADYTPLSFDALILLKYGAYPNPFNAIPGYAIPGLAIPGQGLI